MSVSQSPPCFPCVEQPSRVVLTWHSNSNVSSSSSVSLDDSCLLGSNQKGTVRVTRRSNAPQAHQEFVLRAVTVDEENSSDNDTCYYIQNSKTQQYLTVETVEEQEKPSVPATQLNQQEAVTFSATLTTNDLSTSDSTTTTTKASIVDNKEQETQQISNLSATLTSTSIKETERDVAESAAAKASINTSTTTATRTIVVTRSTVDEDQPARAQWRWQRIHNDNSDNNDNDSDKDSTEHVQLISCFNGQSLVCSRRHARINELTEEEEETEHTEASSSSSSSKFLDKGRLLATLQKNVWDIFLQDCNSDNNHQGGGWSVEEVTGELLFLHHADRRVRCDLLGRLTLTENCQGWEVWRFLECTARVLAGSSRSHGHNNNNSKSPNKYVRISSWMHQQFYLCSNAQGQVQALTWNQAYSRKQIVSTKMDDTNDASPDTGSDGRSDKNDASDENDVDSLEWDTEWFVGKTKSTGRDNQLLPDGVEIRSKRFQRLLSVTLDGQLCTLSHDHPADGDDLLLSSSNHHHVENDSKGNTDGIEQHDKTSLVETKKDVPQNESTEEKDGLLKTMDNTLQSTSSASTIWQLEAAHRQRYTLTTVLKTEDAKKNTVVSSVGPFPYVSTHLKQSDEWVVKHEELGGVVSFSTTSADSTQLKESMCVTPEGFVVLKENPHDGSNLWIMKPEQNGYMFQSKLYPHFYLSFQAPSTQETTKGGKSSGTLICGRKDEESEAIRSTNSSDNAFDSPTLLTNRAPQLVVWNLNPCLPRAVSSSKIKTFALGTSVAIGTTVAMPFAMAGAMALLGAVGAEVGLLANIVTVGLTGAEAIASVGVVGATAAIVFSESHEGGALTMDEEKDNEEESDTKSEIVVSKRPFCAWRSW